MYSIDFRKRVFEMKNKENLTFQEVSKRFGIAIRTLFMWQERIEPCLTRNKPAVKIDMKKLETDVQKNPDRYQYERAKDYGVSAWAIGVALRRLGQTYKKNSISPKS
jgi:transposase